MNIGTTEIILALFALALPLALIAATFIALKIYSRNQQDDAAKKCLFCAEMIRPEAIVCRFCGRDLPV